MAGPCGSHKTGILHYEIAGRESERLVVGRYGFGSSGQRRPTVRRTQQQRQGQGSERDQHDQLEIIDISNHRGLPRYLRVERRYPARCVQTKLSFR